MLAQRLDDDMLLSMVRVIDLFLDDRGAVPGLSPGHVPPRRGSSSLKVRRDAVRASPMVPSARSSEAVLWERGSSDERWMRSRAEILRERERRRA